MQNISHLDADTTAINTPGSTPIIIQQTLKATVGRDSPELDSGKKIVGCCCFFSSPTPHHPTVHFQSRFVFVSLKIYIYSRLHSDINHTDLSVIVWNKKTLDHSHVSSLKETAIASGGQTR